MCTFMSSDIKICPLVRKLLLLLLLLLLIIIILTKFDDWPVNHGQMNRHIHKQRTKTFDCYIELTATRLKKTVVWFKFKTFVENSCKLTEMKVTQILLQFMFLFFISSRLTKIVFRKYYIIISTHQKNLLLFKKNIHVFHT